MTSRGKTIAAALVLCALSICVLGAASASALELTAVKCVSKGPGNGNYSAECPTPKKVGGGFETEALSVGTVTEVEGQATTNSHVTGETSKPVAVFKATIAGIAAEVTCGKATLTGKVQNDAGPPMKITGTEGVVTYTLCHASKQTDTTAICAVQGTAPLTAIGEIKTNSLKLENTGVEHNVLIEPTIVGGAFTTFRILKGPAPCFTPATDLEGKVTGKVNAVANTETHAHATFTPATDGAEFKANNGTATYESTQQFWMKGAPTELVGAETF